MLKIKDENKNAHVYDHGSHERAFRSLVDQDIINQPMLTFLVGYVVLVSTKLENYISKRLGCS